MGAGGCSAAAIGNGQGPESTDTTRSSLQHDDGLDGGQAGGGGACGDDGIDCSVVHAQVVATGIPGAGAIAQVGAFHRGDPVHDNPTLAALTAPGQVLDGVRLLVASTSNFGAPLGNAGQYAGSILSLDVSGGPVTVPPGFAAAGGQASANGGSVITYTANNAAFLNSVFNPGAVTAAQVGASLPTGISINNGNGRAWFACAPNGASGPGSITVIDPDGAPLKGPPDPVAGGVFYGDGTNRSASSTHGLDTGAVGTAIFTKSPDGSTKAVFAAAEADGSIVQVHVKFGVDGLVPPGTLSAISKLTPDAAQSNDPSVVTRRGMAFNWVPNRTLYATEAATNTVAAFDISDNGTLFIAAAPRYLTAQHKLDVPVDVAPTMPEVASENFASNSTLGGAADLYVLNRGNNSIVRVNQSDRVIAMRAITVDAFPDFRANGLGVSPDGQTLWVTGQTSGGGGIVVQVPAFGSGPIMPGLMGDAAAAGAKAINDLGSRFLSLAFTPQQGVGPLFNATGCAGCHSDPAPGGMSASIFDTQIGQFQNGTFQPLPNSEGPVERAHAIAELGSTSCTIQAPFLPHGVNAFSSRSTMTLRGTSLIDFVLTTDILKTQAAEPAAIQGHPNVLADGRIGKFGWKANVATLVEFMGDAFRNEMGLTNNISPVDELSACGANAQSPEIDAVPLETVASFLTTMDPPAPSATTLAMPGAAVFHTVGCDGCHTPSLPGPGFAIQLYSDLLVHDMGPGLADGFVMGSASGSEFRTMTLAAMSERSHFLHDGRAHTIADAIAAHGGQAGAAATAYANLSASDQAALLAFVGSL